MNPLESTSAAADGDRASAGGRLLNASVVALCLLLLLWELWLAPLRPGGSWLALKTLPLALALPGLLRGSRYTRQWMSLLLPFYFAEGVVRAFSEAGRVRWLASGEIVLAVIAFMAILTMLRKRKLVRSPAEPGPRGFTLIELTSAIAIVTVLAFVAWPNYVNYRIKANRSAAQALLIDLANRQQLYVLDARNYASSLTDLGIAAVPPDVGSYYAIADPVVDNGATPPTFIVSAIAREGTIQAKDGDLSINSVGMRSGHW